jgi:hypothetical protein
MAEIAYALVTSAIRIRAAKVTTSDSFAPPRSTVEDLQVELVHRAGPTRTLRTGTGKGDQELSVRLTSDGRLQSIEYNTTGIGGAVVTASAKMLAFVGSLAAAVVRTGNLAAADKRAPDPREAWAEKHPEEAAQLARLRQVASTTAAKLADVREQMAHEDGVIKLRNLAVREGMLESNLDILRSEIGRLEDLYKSWRNAHIARSSARVERLVDVEQLPVRGSLDVPNPATLKPPLDELWNELGVLVEVVDPKRNAASPPPEPDDLSHVTWRVPRPIELWVWKRGDDGPVLVSQSTVHIADAQSGIDSIELRGSLFGAHGGSLTFNDDGRPAALKIEKDSPVGAFANAFGSVPAAVTESVGHAKKLTDTWHELRDASAEREKAAAERELATARARLELVGVHATADDFAALKRAEQALKLRAATRAISPDADAVDDLKRQLDLVTAQADIEAKRRAARVDADLEMLRAEVARLELEVKAAKARRGGADPPAA